MRVYFIRHGETQYNKDGLLAGQTDIPLTEEGRKQVADAQKQLPDNISAIFCSDLIRCRETAEILNEKFNLPISYDSRLRERHFGHYEGTPWNDLTEDLQVRDRNMTYDYTSSGGEHAVGVEERLMKMIEDIKKSGHENVLIVTHGGVIALIHYLLNKNLYTERIHNASIHEFEL